MQLQEVVQVADFWDNNTRYLINEDDHHAPTYWVKPNYAAVDCKWDKLTMLYGPVDERQARAMQLVQLLAELLDAAPKRDHLVRRLTPMARWYLHQPAGVDYFYATECPYVCEGCGETETAPMIPTRQNGELCVSKQKALRYCRDVHYSSAERRHTAEFTNLLWTLWSLDMLPVYTTAAPSFLVDNKTAERYYVMRARLPGDTDGSQLPPMWPSFQHEPDRVALRKMLGRVDFDTLDRRLRSADFLRLLRWARCELLFDGKTAADVARLALTRLAFACDDKKRLAVMLDKATAKKNPHDAWQTLVATDYVAWEETFIVGPVEEDSTSKRRRLSHSSSSSSSVPPPAKRRKRVIDDEDEDETAASPSEDEDTTTAPTTTTENVLLATPEQIASQTYADETLVGGGSLVVNRDDVAYVFSLPFVDDHEVDDDDDDDVAALIYREARETRQPGRRVK